MIIVLHHYKLTRFSNGVYEHKKEVKFYTITNLQGSQTGLQVIFTFDLFYTITNLQGSQTSCRLQQRPFWFYTITNLQGSQTHWTFCTGFALFYTITNLQGSQTPVSIGYCAISFTPLQTYKVLKPILLSDPFQVVLHHYKLTRFSNILHQSNSKYVVLHHYKLTRFSNLTN